MIKRTIIATILAIVCITGNLTAGQWVYRPMTINAKKGDIVLSAEKGMIEDVIKAVSGYWEHVGMVIDGGKTIRHNTRYADSIVIDWNYIKIFGMKIKTLPKGFNPDSLENGLPGIINEDINTAFYGERSRFHLANGIVVKPRAHNEALYRNQLKQAADKMIGLDGYYRIGAYSDMFQQDDTGQKIKGRGSMCSSAVWFAHHFTGKNLNYSQFSPELSYQVGEIIYQSVINQIADEYGFWGKVLFGIQNIFGTGLDKKIANQVTNTFGCNRSWDQTDYWRKNRITAVTVSPDGLLLNTFANPSGKIGGVQTEGKSPYESVEPVVITNGYWYYVD